MTDTPTQIAARSARIDTKRHTHTVKTFIFVTTLSNTAIGGSRSSRWSNVEHRKTVYSCCFEDFLAQKKTLEEKWKHAQETRHTSTEPNWIGGARTNKANRDVVANGKAPGTRKIIKLWQYSSGRLGKTSENCDHGRQIKADTLRRIESKRDGTSQRRRKTQDLPFYAGRHEATGGVRAVGSATSV